MVSFLMIGSLVLGLIAWALPAINIARYKQSFDNNWAIYSIVSVSACAVSISFQLIYCNYIVIKEDWAALMDTVGVSTGLSVFLLISTLVLNATSLILYKFKK
ncbi:MAG: hypothetical protein WBI74_12560 [Caldicoprobacterales bacterium]|jgi:hypothetical protein|nr:hypothetical protein [Clostridiales bacterium]